jgi:hypothetical protein
MQRFSTLYYSTLQPFESPFMYFFSLAGRLQTRADAAMPPSQSPSQ